MSASELDAHRINKWSKDFRVRFPGLFCVRTSRMPTRQGGWNTCHLQPPEGYLAQSPEGYVADVGDTTELLVPRMPWPPG